MKKNIKQHVIQIRNNVTLNNYDNNSINFYQKDIPDLFFKISKLNIYSILVIVMIGYMFYIHYSIGLLLVLFTCIIYLIQRTYIKMLVRKTRNNTVTEKRFDDILREITLRAIEVNHFIDESINKKEYIVLNKDINSFNLMSIMLKVIGTFTILLYLMYLVHHNIISSTSLLLVTLYILCIYSFLGGAIILRYYRSQLSLYRNCFYGTRELTCLNEKKKNARSCNGQIIFDNVYFKYRTKRFYALYNCSFLINPKETVALVCKNNENQSAIINLILGNYHATQGTVKIDNKDISLVSYNYITKHISVVSQNSFILDVSIRDNLKGCNTSISDASIKKVCNRLGISSCIDSLPNKYDTIINNELELSYVKREILGIARAVLNKSKIIIINEIPNNINKKELKELNDVISIIKKDCTVIIATKEISILNKCDKVICIDNYTVAGIGKHRSLLKNNDNYKKIFKDK